jgi:acetyl-CoA carboxylase carboxyltransferase component
MPQYTLETPFACVITAIHVQTGDTVQSGQEVAVIEAMKMQTPLLAPCSGTVTHILLNNGDTVQRAATLMSFDASGDESATSASTTATSTHTNLPLQQARARLDKTLDGERHKAAAKRYAKGYRTARENLDDICDTDSFIEYGQLAIAAQRQRRDIDELRSATAADGILTGLATINAEYFGTEAAQAAVVVNDYSVLAGTQGYFHHKKLDRILHQAKSLKLPVVMYTEGGGGRPGDTDVSTQIAGLDIGSFVEWAALSGVVPRIAVNNGYCFAGNAALFGCADITIATRNSWIGMAGPAMIEGGGLGEFAPTDIGPSERQYANGVIDLLADNEADATRLAKRLLGYFQGTLPDWQAAEQEALRDALPEDRRFTYDVRKIINLLADADSVTELRAPYGRAIITSFIRIEGRPVGLIANDCKVLGGAIDAEAAEKCARFLQLCDAHGIPVLSLCDTPGFMVGPDSEDQAAVRRLSRLFVTGASLQIPLTCIFLRKAYGLGAMAMAGGSFARPVYSASWPQGEFGGMGLEGAVQLGFKKELAACASEEERKKLYDELLGALYDNGKATEAAAFLEIDAVIDPADTRAVVLRAFDSAGSVKSGTRSMVDTW